MNVELAEQVCGVIEADLKAWKQNNWGQLNDHSDPECGTTCCFGGWTVVQAGD